MKKFISLTVLFTVPILLLLICLEIGLRQIPNDYSYKKNYLDQKAGEIEVLYLGSSHVFYGINPQLSTFNGFNASHISQTLNIDLSILEKYSDKWEKLKYLIIPIDYFSIYSTIENGIESWRLKNYSIYYNMEGIRGLKNRFELPNGKVKDNFSRIISYMRGGTDITCTSLGWGTNYNSKDGRNLVETGKTGAKRHTSEPNEKVINSNIFSLNRIIQFAKERGLKVIFFTSPCYSTYVENLNTNQFKTTVGSITELVSQNHNFTSYYNLLQHKAFLAEDFYDADHLNEKGARKLTLLIDSLIINHQFTY